MTLAAKHIFDESIDNIVNVFRYLTDEEVDESIDHIFDRILIGAEFHTKVDPKQPKEAKPVYVRSLQWNYYGAQEYPIEVIVQYHDQQNRVKYKYSVCAFSIQGAVDILMNEYPTHITGPLDPAYF